jgi:glucuronoarabinoxylan endo-1,4-beta-xylanase
MQKQPNLIACAHWFSAVWFRGFSGLALAVFLQGGTATGQNLVANPGFETGNTSGWYGFGSPTISSETAQVHSGSYAALVTNRTATYMGIAQSFQGVMQAGQIYNISAWLQLVSGTNQTMQLTMQQVDGGGTGYTLIAAGSVSTNGWTQLSGQFTFSQSGSLTSLVLYAEVPSSTNAAYYIDDISVLAPAATATNGQCLIDWTNVFQRIDGFGASSAWNSSWTTVQADMFFSTNTGIGLSLLRNHITFASSTAATAIPTTVETSIMQMAQARGARVWSAPWTPAVGFKKTNDIYDSLPITNAVNGGSYLGSGNNATNLAYASQLANYVSTMKNSYGVNIYAISMQNEPDARVNTYEACQWTGQQLHDFSTNLYAALADKGVGLTKIILPESQNWASNSGLWTPTLSDANAAAAVNIIANHNYVADNGVGDQTTPATINTFGKALWETEVAQLSGSDSSITNAIYWAGRIHLFLTAAQANAWHYWWLVASGNQGLADASGNTTKRMYALGQFARFVRPNYYRIGVDTNSGPLQISGYKDPVGGGFAIVAINSGINDVSQVFNLLNFSGVTTVTPWITSASLSLVSQPAVAVSGQSFSYVLPAMSVVTFVGQNPSNSAPTLAPVADQTVNAGVTLVITNVAADPNLPPQTLSFDLLNGPVNATLATVSGTNGVFTWRPPVSLAGTTNPVSVQVTDSGNPSLSATNRFKVIVNSLTPPVLGAPVFSGGTITMITTGPEGPDYTLWMTTNLASSWQALLTTNAPQLPLTLTVTNAGSAVCFYRIQVGP